MFIFYLPLSLSIVRSRTKGFSVIARLPDCQITSALPLQARAVILTTPAKLILQLGVYILIEMGVVRSPQSAFRSP